MAQQKVVLRVPTMNDDKMKRKEMKAAINIYGVESVAVDRKEQKLTVIGNMDPLALVAKLRKVAKVDIVSIGPAEEEKKEKLMAEEKAEILTPSCPPQTTISFCQDLRRESPWLTSIDLDQLHHGHDQEKEVVQQQRLPPRHQLPLPRSRSLARLRKNLKLKKRRDTENVVAPSIESGTDQHRSRALPLRTEPEIANLQQEPMQGGTLSSLRQADGPSEMPPEATTQNQRILMEGITGLTEPPERHEDLSDYEESSDPKGLFPPSPGRGKSLKLEKPRDTENEVAPSNETGTDQHQSRALPLETEPEIANIKQEHMQGGTLSSLRQTDGLSEMLPEATTQNQRILMQRGMRMTTPPECEEWERSIEIYLMDNEFSELPETLRCPVLKVLFLSRNSRLRKIPESFFDNMPALQILDISRTRIKSLPKSLFQLNNLKRLFLKYCELLMKLQPEIGKLRNLEILDLEGTRITSLPKEVQHLTTLKCLKLSFDDPVNHRKELSNEVIPGGVLSALAQLEELHIDVSPDDKRWNACVVAVASEVCGLTTLNTLKFYFPQVELLSCFYWSNPEGESLSLSHFRLTVGHHIKRIMSRTPHNIELEMEQYERCLKYVNGAGVPEEIKMVLQFANAFFLDRHTDIKTLSELGCENMMQLIWCMVGECNEISAIINGDQMRSCSSSENNISLIALKYLHIYRMKNLRSIWEGRVLDKGFTSLKTLTLRTCPQLTTIFTPELLTSFSNLEELLVDDCPVMTSLVSCDNSECEATCFLPKLKKVSLHYLPALATISNTDGISMPPTVEWISVYYCPKLLFLPIDKGYHTSLKKIKCERSWWEALQWTSKQQHSWDDIFVPINACD